MKHYIGCDAHKKYSVFVAVDETGRLGPARRVEHDRGSFRAFLQTLPPHSPIAVESTGNWYWLIDEMENAGHAPSLVNPGKAKPMMGLVNKSDKLDAGGLGVLLRNGTLPSVWIPPGDLRDQRELPRMRMALVSIRTKLKNRIHATLAKYQIVIEDVKDLFGKKGRQLMSQHLDLLPPETRHSVQEQLALLEQVQASIDQVEERIGQVIKTDETMRLLMTIPGVGPVLSTVIALEVGTVDRFADATHLASYAGTVPRVISSGGRTHYGKVRPDVNRYLKWAFTEAANSIVAHQRWMGGRHVLRLYNRIRQHKGHAKAITAVARHLAEATYWMLKKNEPYKEPKAKTLASSTQGVSASFA